MRSESEISWIRAKNNVGQATKATDWHAMIAGVGSQDIPPGTVCNTSLTGSLQTIQHSGIRTIDGVKHRFCVDFVTLWLKGIDPSPGPRKPDEPDQEFAPPGSTKHDD